MARYTGPKDRLSRREGFDLFGKGIKFTRINITPGMHGPKGYSSRSQYGKQLREKQKVKRMYGLMEKQFRKYVDMAFKSRGNTGNTLATHLERRLDNIVFRLGFAPTRPSARQLVSHRHILVDGKKVNIASYQVSVGQSITLDNKSQAIPTIKKSLQDKVKVPGWLKRKAIVGIVDKFPTIDDVTEPVSMQDIVEFYSR